MSLLDVIPSADAQGGGPVGCSTAKIGSRTLLGLQEVAPQGLLAWNDVATVGDIQKGWAFF